MYTRSEKRQHFRESIHLAGTAVMDSGLFRIPVTLVNLSRTGAMLAVSGPVRLDQDFTLLYRNSLAPCRVVWREQDHAGVQFHETPAAVQTHVD